MKKLITITAITAILISACATHNHTTKSTAYVGTAAGGIIESTARAT